MEKNKVASNPIPEGKRELIWSCGDWGRKVEPWEFPSFMTLMINECLGTSTVRWEDGDASEEDETDKC